MQTTKTTPYHCAELRRSVPVLQRIEWVSGIGQDDAEPVVLAEAWGRLRKRKKSYAKTGLASRVVGVPLVTPAGLRLGLVENSVLCGDDPRSCTHRRCAHRQQSLVAASYGRC